MCLVFSNFLMFDWSKNEENEFPNGSRENKFPLITSKFIVSTPPTQRPQPPSLDNSTPSTPTPCSHINALGILFFYLPNIFGRNYFSSYLTHLNYILSSNKIVKSLNLINMILPAHTHIYIYIYLNYSFSFLIPSN